jgi:cytochrome c-type protein NapB
VTTRISTGTVKKGLVLAIVLPGLLATVTCSSSDESPVPPTPLPTVQSTPTDTPAEPTPTTPPAATAVPTVSPTATSVATATPASDPLFILGLLATGEVDPNRFANIPPGDAALLDRAYPGAPPQVPHRADDLTITVDKNSCMTCHESGKTINGDVAVQVPISHYTDFTTGTVSGELYGGRYVCTSCHVPQVIDDPPEVSQ